jgi:NADH-quinone oxidoreductase subunit N
MWAPDVYDGAPSPITAYMAATVKTAAFAAFIRVWLEAFPYSFQSWQTALAGLAIATMVLGNAIGLAQKNLKRMLAYSSIGHAGYLLVAVAAGNIQGSSAAVFYLFVYTLATFGAFAVVVSLTRDGQNTVMLDELDGLWTVRPGLALAMTVIMLALMGFPIFGGAGFLAKWYVLQAALQPPARQTYLAVVLVLTTVISAGYYLYVLVRMFMRPRPDDAPVLEESGGMTNAVLALSVALILLLGLVPQGALDAARRGVPRIEQIPGTMPMMMPPFTGQVDVLGSSGGDSGGAVPPVGATASSH